MLSGVILPVYKIVKGELESPGLVDNAGDKNVFTSCLGFEKNKKK